MRGEANSRLIVNDEDGRNMEAREVEDRIFALVAVLRKEKREFHFEI